MNFDRKKPVYFISVAILLLFALHLSSVISRYAADAQESVPNLIAVHDSTSKQYNKNCYGCHSYILSEKSLNPAIPDVHVAMLPNTPGNRERKCVWCHRTVDLVQGSQRVERSKSNLRKGVNTTLCTLCHGPEGPGSQFYQTDLLPDPPDGPFLYELVCAACHKALANSQMKGKSASEIQKAIDKNEGGMGPLYVLRPEEVKAIANALAQ